MSTKSNKPVAIVGGGPAGSVAALCLRKLGREVVVFEKQKFPRYRIGESLLPGTMSILSRLDVIDRVKAANFTVKPAATFIWGQREQPWSFSFATPKTAPWVFDHSYQVNRAEYDQILLETARERGAEIKESYEVTGIDLDENGGPATLYWKNGEAEGQFEADFVIDASGSRGIIANKLKLRQWDKYYRNLAIWSYFKGGKRYHGDLAGNILSVTFKEGWIWLIPLKDDMYSVGVVTGVEHADRLREMGADAFYQECLDMCPTAVDVLSTAERCDDVRIVRDWAYTASRYSLGRVFLTGDSACFIDPLFSSGVHLATYSGMMAAAAIDHLYDAPENADQVVNWYQHSYSEAYDRYHQFLSAFYATVDEPESTFWNNRRVQGADDARFEGRDWFTSLTGQKVAADAEGVNEIEDQANTLAYLWERSSDGLSDDFDEDELTSRRLQWGSQLVKQLKSMRTIRWQGDTVSLTPSYKVHPTTFRLEEQQLLGDGNGRVLTAFPMNESHRDLFLRLQEQPLSYRELSKELKRTGTSAPVFQVIMRMVEAGLLAGYDKNGDPVKVQSALRFGGVGADDEMS